MLMWVGPLWNFINMTLWHDDVSMLAQCPLQSPCCLVVESVSDTRPLANSRLTSMHTMTLTSETVGRASPDWPLYLMDDVSTAFNDVTAFIYVCVGMTFSFP